MLGSLLKYSIWSGGRCLTFIQQLDEMRSRAEGLAAVFPYLDKALLPEAERLLVLTKVDFQETIAPALTAYCLRLWDIGEHAAAVEYARQWEPGIARSVGLVRLAARIDQSDERSKLLRDALIGAEDFDAFEFSDLVDGMRSAFGGFYESESSSRSREEWITPGLSPDDRSEGLRRALEMIGERKGSQVKLDELASVDYGQFLDLFCRGCPGWKLRECCCDTLKTPGLVANGRRSLHPSCFPRSLLLYRRRCLARQSMPPRASKRSARNTWF